jgi:hypothetical protein
MNTSGQSSIRGMEWVSQHFRRLPWSICARQSEFLAEDRNSREANSLHACSLNLCPGLLPWLFPLLFLAASALLLCHIRLLLVARIFWLRVQKGVRIPKDVNAVQWWTEMF